MGNIQKAYDLAREKYLEIGVDTEKALNKLAGIPVSIHCWELDDLSGFEYPDRGLDGGIAVFGAAPGKPASREEYLEHLSKALSLIPGSNRVALHATYLDKLGTELSRSKIEPRHFASWVDYARDKKIGLDFNPTYFSHPMSDSGFTLSSADDGIRNFWIEHSIACRKIGEYFGRELGSACITNHWMPDGFKDKVIDTIAPRARLADSLDRIFAERIDDKYNIDSVESKLFGLGSESYVVGSHEFYTNYVANRKNCIICMDAGHYHPTEVVSQKLASYWLFDQKVMLHISRPVRWDSDHVVILDDETRALMSEIVRCGALDKTFIGTDYFDASINRIAATVLGARSVKKALLAALLEPVDILKRVEAEGDFTKRLVLTEELKTMPLGAVWDMFCEQNGMPGENWLGEIKY